MQAWRNDYAGCVLVRSYQGPGRDRGGERGNAALLDW